eukprot:991000_1
MSECKDIITKKNVKTYLQTFDLMDESGRIQVSLWGDQADIILTEFQIIAIKRARVSDYGGRSLSVAGYIETSPNHCREKEMYKWKQKKKDLLVTLAKRDSSITNDEKDFDFEEAALKTVAEVHEDDALYRESDIFPSDAIFKVRAYIRNIESDMWFEKHGKLHWCVKFILYSDANAEWFRVIAFSKAVKQLFGDLTADDASKMQIKDPTKFSNLVLEAEQHEKQRTFFLRTKQNNYKSSKNLDYI